MDWSKPYSVTYRCERLDPDDGMHVDDIDMISCSFSFSDEGIGLIGSMETVTPVLDYPIVRITARAEQGDDVETVILFTGKAHCTGKKWTLDDPTFEAELVGLLDMVNSRCPEKSIPQKANRAEAAADLLRKALPRWVGVSVEKGSPLLAEPMPPEGDETNLTLAEKLLDCGWHMRRLGTGDIEICPYGGTRTRIDVKDNDVLMPDITDQRDIYEAVNVLKVVTFDGSSVTVRNERLIGLIGFERQETERDVTLSDDETLDEYARKGLAERNDFHNEISWSREWIPGLCCGDDIEADIVSHGITGDYRITTMDIICETGITVDEVVRELG